MELEEGKYFNSSSRVCVMLHEDIVLIFFTFEKILEGVTFYFIY